MLNKILNLAGVDILTKTDQIKAQVSEETAALNTSFMCYCNGIYVGEKKSVQDCWRTC